MKKIYVKKKMATEKHVVSSRRYIFVKSKLFTNINKFTKYSSYRCLNTTKIRGFWYFIEIIIGCADDELV